MALAGCIVHTRPPLMYPVQLRVVGSLHMRVILELSCRLLEPFGGEQVS